MTIISYAQNYEDIILRRALKNVDFGFYIDIGACDPDADSVTRLFYDKGWRGINVEPNTHYLEMLTKKRPDDVNLGLAVSNTKGRKRFFVVNDTGLSTLDPSIVQSHIDSGWKVTEVSVPVSTLEQIWRDNIPKTQDVHFLKIDVEGGETEVILSGNWATQRPWIVVVEAIYPDGKGQSHHEWEHLLLANGYTFAYWDGLNRFYVANEHKDIIDSLAIPPNVFDDFISYAHALVLRHSEKLESRLADMVDEKNMRIKVMKKIEHLGRKQNSLEESVLHSSDRLSELDAQIESLQGAMHQIQDQLFNLNRSLFHRIFFKKSGVPKKFLRRLLFHTSGQPRAYFKRIVIRKRGVPRDIFLQWMESEAYRSLKRPLVLKKTTHNVPNVSFAAPHTFSYRIEYFMDRLNNLTVNERN